MPEKKDSDQLPETECLLGMKEIFRQIAEHAHVGIWLLDGEGTIFYANTAAEKIWARAPMVSPDEYKTYRAWDHETGKLIGLDDWPAMRALRTGEAILDHLVRIERFDGNPGHVLISAIPIKDEAGKIGAVLVMNHDLTEIKASEARREELVKIVSHDMKNPLHAINMSTQYLQGKLEHFLSTGHTEKIHQYLSAISGSVSVCLDLVKNILEKDSDPRSPIPVQREDFLICELMGSLKPVYDPLVEEKGLTLRWELPIGERIYGDKERICQVISNIIGNAIKFTPAGGEVRVSAAAEEGQMVFTIEDTGPGIDEVHLEKIFQRKFQGPASAQGTGLGLYIAQMIVRAHTGKIWAQSSPGKGLVVSFSLPARS